MPLNVVPCWYRNHDNGLARRVWRAHPSQVQLCFSPALGLRRTMTPFDVIHPSPAGYRLGLGTQYRKLPVAIVVDFQVSLSLSGLWKGWIEFIHNHWNHPYLTPNPPSPGIPFIELDARWVSIFKCHRSKLRKGHATNYGAVSKVHS